MQDEREDAPEDAGTTPDPRPEPPAEDARPARARPASGRGATRAKEPDRWRRLWRVPARAKEPDWWRRHGWFAAVLAAGAALRALAMLGYRPALWFPDSYTYIVTVFKPRPDLVRPAGYSMFMKLLEPFHGFWAVTAAQHLLGLATGVIVYRAARRAPTWARTLAAVPVLLDAYQVELEHLLVSDALFTFLVVAAVSLSLTKRPATVAAIGLLLAAATLTRTVGQPLIVVLAAWFVLRRRAGLAGVLLAAALVPLIAYGGWFYATYQRAGLVGANGVFLYARTMAFADCAAMNPPADLRVLCDPRPPEQRPPSQEYIWAKDSPLVKLPGITFTKETDDLASRFATLAITRQPLDYAASVLGELGRTFAWGRPIYPDPEVYAYYEFPATPPGPPGRYPAQVGADYAKLYEQGAIGTEIVEPYAGWLRTYQKMVRVPGPVLLALLLAPPVTAIVRRARGRRRSGAPDWLVPWSVAVVLLVTPPAVAEFDYRYVLPAVPLACLAAALCVRPDPRRRPDGRKDFINDIPRNVRL